MRYATATVAGPPRRGEPMAQDYYSTLGVESDASPSDIKKAFRQIARECHPDVAGDDPVAAERFKNARKAYETLMDPVTRARYDRRGQHTGGAPRGGSFFDAFYRHTAGGGGLGGADDTPNAGSGAPGRRGPAPAAHDAGGHRSGGRASRADPGNHMDLEDLFRDFGDFGFGGGGGRARGAPGAGPSASARGPQPQPGGDVHIDLDIPGRVAREGGTVTAVYHRLQRADSWRPGSTDPGILRVQDIADLRILPGVRDGDVLVERGLGDAGTYGGPYGNLHVHVRLLADSPRPERPAAERAPAPEPRRPDARPASPRAADPAEAEPDGHVDISVVEALLGGRVEIATPSGLVRVTIPAGTSSGAVLRLKGRGPDGTDLHLRTRIVVPRQLDDESRALIERFAELNPGDPRSE